GRKRKWWTVLHNDQVLVTALLLIPGERSVRHSHETGELSIHYDGELRPVVVWNPPGVLHPSIPPAAGETMTDELADAAEQGRGGGGRRTGVAGAGSAAESPGGGAGRNAP